MAFCKNGLMPIGCLIHKSLDTISGGREVSKYQKTPMVRLITFDSLGQFIANKVTILMLKVLNRFSKISRNPLVTVVVVVVVKKTQIPA